MKTKAVPGLCLTLLALGTTTFGDQYHPNHGTKHARRFRRSVNDGPIEDKAYWEELGQSEIEASLEVARRSDPDAHAKNVIIFIGDGMSIPTVTAARIYKAQKLDQNNFNPESQYLTFERFDHMGLTKTYDIDKQTADSAATANAMFSGVKTKHGTIGFDANIERGFPETMNPAIEVTTIMTNAQEVGMSTGIVTTARLTHATPSGMFAHVMDRDWECDAAWNEVKHNDSTLEVPPDGYKDIAWQLINDKPGRNTKVIIGGGYPAFFPTEMTTQLNSTYGPYSEDYWDCYRTDGIDLTKKWLKQKEDNGETAAFVMTKEDLDAVDLENTDNLFGLFAQSHMEYDHNRVEGRDPPLAELVQAAIKVLQKNDEGFLLLVEGGRIDHAHHEIMAQTALDEVVAMDLAVETAITSLGDSLDDTLIIVTADHAHTMSIAGYAARGHSIVGLSGEVYDDDLPYTTLSYANGKAFYGHNIPFNQTHVTRQNLTNHDTLAFEFEYASSAPRESETHGGDDVAIFAQGPGSVLFQHTHEQTHVYHVMAYALCIGDYIGYAKGDKICDQRSAALTSSSSQIISNSYLACTALCQVIALMIIMMK